ncbi:hypothetical protein [Abditibacterium utsteinense]|uniref:hypothetical protein n=1 Tax=Abditibacterium utsteinense TaxID=1960156 RepID=UPI00130061F9|nr:hypothetical protein [Abditibacterium utsteinense]
MAFGGDHSPRGVDLLKIDARESKKRLPGKIKGRDFRKIESFEIRPASIDGKR